MCSRIADSFSFLLHMVLVSCDRSFHRDLLVHAQRDLQWYLIVAQLPLSHGPGFL